MENPVDKIREKYPTPSTCNPASIKNNGYCVGGAYILSLLNTLGHSVIKSEDDRFPSEQRLAAFLGCTEEEAEKITDANDSGNFELAWSLLNKALIIKQNRD